MIDERIINNNNLSTFIFAFGLFDSVELLLIIDGWIKSSKEYINK